MTGIADQALDLSWRDAWRHEARNTHGEWTHGESLPGVGGNISHGFKGRFTGEDVLRPGMAPAAGHEALNRPGRPEGVAQGTAVDPIDVRGDLKRAVELMAAGEHVRLNSPAELPGLMDEINHQGDMLGAAIGHNLPWDLGMVSVKGTRLFNEQTIGTPRQDMPQLNGPAEPGTQAAILAGGANRFVELDPEFRAQLHKDGIEVRNERVPVSQLRATQTQLTATTVAGIYRAARAGNPEVLHMLKEPLWASRDNYVLDGHHRWAADTVLRIASGQWPRGQAEVQRIDLPVRDAVQYALGFAQGMGIGGRALGNNKLVEASNISDLAWEGWRTEPRDRHGRWTRTAGEGIAVAAMGGGLLRGVKKFLDETGETPEEAAARHNRRPASPEIHAFAAKASKAVPGILGGGTEGFSGNVWVLDRLSDPGNLAQMEWNGDMTLRSDVADLVQKAITSDEPVDPSPVEDVEHELIHGVTATGDYESNKKAYQELAVAQIEEGFTELGAIQHAPEFFEAMGLSGHKTELQGSPTMGEVAAQLSHNMAADSGRSNWGHYQIQVAAAYGWLDQIATAEGAADKEKRIKELADQINQRGAAGKVDVMAAQVLSAVAKGSPGGWGDLGITPDLLDSIRKQIKQGFTAGDVVQAFKQSASVAQARLAALAAERQFSGIAAQVLDLSWKDAWRHERRDAHGRWTRSGSVPSGQGLKGEKYPGHNSYKIGSFWRGETNADGKQALNLAGASYDAGDYLAAADYLRSASDHTNVMNAQSDYWNLANDIEEQAMKADPVGAVQKRISNIKDIELAGSHESFTTRTEIKGALNDAASELDKAANSTGSDDDIAGHLQAAADSIGGAAAFASVSSDLQNWLYHLSTLTKEIKAQDLPSSPGSLRSVTTAFVKKGADTAVKAVGGDHESWNGKVNIEDVIQGNPAVLGVLDWDRQMGIQTDVAKAIRTALDMTGEPVNDPAAFVVPLHELIHGVVEKGNRVGEDKLAYQTPSDAAIEEGFTELGTIHHAPEYFGAMGLGDRQTQILSEVDGGPVPNPDWEVARKALHDRLRDEAGRLRSISGSMSSPEWEAAVHVDEAANDVDANLPNQALADLYELQHLGRSQGYENAMKLRKEIQDFAEIPQSQHSTMDEYARRLQDPSRIAQGQAWGHYPEQTRAAQEWVQAVAMAEAGSRPFDATLTGKDHARVVELADEINRVGTAKKLNVMAAQIARAAGVTVEPDSEDEDSLMENIRQGYGELARPSGKDAFRNAMNAARYMRKAA